jgi:iron complex transport system ATP-binding protein
MSAGNAFATQGVAVIMVMHDVNLAARHANKMLAMLCSQTIAYGACKDVITADIIQRLFQVDAEIMTHPKDGSPMVVGL